MELKGITCRIPLELHNRISGEIREMGSTMGQFVEMIIREHYEKGEKKMMEKGRALAFQVSEELFQKVKEYLAWYEKTYHRRLTQKEFVIGLIEEALEELEAEMEKESQDSEARAGRSGKQRSRRMGRKRNPSRTEWSEKLGSGRTYRRGRRRLHCGEQLGRNRRWRR